MNPLSSEKSLRKKAPHADSVLVLCFRKAAADLEHVSISRSYRSAPNCILLSPFQIPPSVSHISHRLIEAWLTKLTPPINPFRDLQKTDPGSSAWNRKITERKFGITNKYKTLQHDSGLLEDAIRDQHSVQSIIQKAVGASWKPTLFTHNLSTGHPQATSWKLW